MKGHSWATEEEQGWKVEMVHQGPHAHQAFHSRRGLAALLSKWWKSWDRAVKAEKGSLKRIHLVAELRTVHLKYISKYTNNSPIRSACRCLFKVGHSLVFSFLSSLFHALCTDGGLADWEAFPSFSVLSFFPIYLSVCLYEHLSKRGCRFFNPPRIAFELVWNGGFHLKSLPVLRCSDSLGVNRPPSPQLFLFLSPSLQTHFSLQYWRVFYV